MQWLVTARTDKGRFAYLGFNDVWYPKDQDDGYGVTEAYAVTDRPVYQPKQKVHYKFWVRRAQYDMPDTSEFADREVRIEIGNPRGNHSVRDEDDRRLRRHRGRVHDCRRRPAGAYSIGLIDPQAPKDATTLGSRRFRVEEYKKPEFEVTVETPSTPVQLGEKIIATIRAKYYFGAPVTHAKVRYRIRRSSYHGHPYPAMPWDWFYGPGYWWFAMIIVGIPAGADGAGRRALARLVAPTRIGPTSCQRSAAARAGRHG